MFDPVRRTWEKKARLPKPLSAAKMELLAGKPTIVGGFDNEEQNDILYQYDYKRDSWSPLPGIKLRKARSSAAVFQVPWNLFNDC